MAGKSKKTLTIRGQSPVRETSPLLPVTYQGGHSPITAVTHLPGQTLTWQEGHLPVWEDGTKKLSLPVEPCLFKLDDWAWFPRKALDTLKIW